LPDHPTWWAEDAGETGAGNVLIAHTGNERIRAVAH